MMLKTPWKIVHFPELGYKPGLLIIAQNFLKVTELFEECRRVYWIINNTPYPVERGGHFHPAGGKKEILVCLNGRAEIIFHSADGCENIDLDYPSVGVVIREETWHKVILSPGAILLAIASTVQSPDEAIEFLPRCQCREFR